ncbi:MULTISPECIES: DUF4139 domain-containing protein [unclassified Meiothermus]|uniref:DUF4139 domain-containing protein n=1 Tax=unclassified Meiothermus TaxID=370471 RepID=UPI000D7C420A|nr:MULTISPECIES: hypothetical protein [unclassified Meiothermus]PZA08714.1 hypothetical protein DNA98_01310 [Meiothermus sp. Pnk-1]RYM40666.1 hypothetical protein EWH23_00625 [Meiothermus sp. PNK-Is4]
MNKALLTLGIATLIGAVQAQEAAFYRGFAEVKTPVTLPAGEWRWQPGESLFETLVPGTLKLLGLSEQSRQVILQDAPNPLAAYKGKAISFYWEGKWREAVVVDPDRPLFQFEGHYLTSLPGLVAYPDPSGFQNPRLEVVFRYQGQGPTTLSYLTRGLSWSLRYTLEGGDLTGWASLHNSLGTPQRFRQVELVAGTVPLLEGGIPVPKAATAPAPEVRSMAADAEFSGESGGTFRYRLPGEVNLEPGLTELPFIRARVQPTYTWSYAGGFTTASEIRFQRGYRFAATENLAAGIVSIRDQGVFVGQAALPDTAKGNPVRLSLGPDPDGQAERKIEQLAQNSFRVTTTVKNPKAYPLEVEISEFFPRPFTLEGQGLEKTPEGYRVRFNLNPGQARVLVYTVTLPR